MQLQLEHGQLDSQLLNAIHHGQMTQTECIRTAHVVLTGQSGKGKSFIDMCLTRSLYNMDVIDQSLINDPDATKACISYKKRSACIDSGLMKNYCDCDHMPSTPCMAVCCELWSPLWHTDMWSVLCQPYGTTPLHHCTTPIHPHTINVHFVLNCITMAWPIFQSRPAVSNLVRSYA